MIERDEDRSRKWRRRAVLAILAAVLLGAVASPFHGRLQESAVWPGRAAAVVLSPFVAVARGLRDGAAATWNGVFDGANDEWETALLEEEILKLQAENEHLNKQNEELRDLSEADEKWKEFEFDLAPARIVSYSSRYYSQGCVVDLGPNDGIRQGMIALTLDGVAGVVRRTGGGISAVQLVTDRRFRVGARLEGDDVVGLLRGTGDPDEMIFDSAGQRVELTVGTRIKTAGTEGSLFPEGLTLGHISAIVKDRQGRDIAHVRPAARPEREVRLYIVRNSGIVDVNERGMER
jgi:rod shape-determining protein MreC